MERIIGHWTAGGHRASHIDRKHYHFIFEGDGTEVAGDWPISANRRPKKGRYAAHTLNCNTGSIGLAVACMRRARENPLNFGTAPMTETQWDAMCRKAAELCIAHGIPVTPKTVLSHAEVQPTLGIKQRGKWDFTRLPFAPELKGHKACGDRFRADVRRHIDQILNPAPPTVPMIPGEVSDMIEDADKPVLASTTSLAAIGQVATTAGGVAASLQGIDWRVAIAFLSVGALLGFYIIRERMRKADLARKARGA